MYDAIGVTKGAITALNIAQHEAEAGRVQPSHKQNDLSRVLSMIRHFQFSTEFLIKSRRLSYSIGIPKLGHVEHEELRTSRMYGKSL